MSRFCSLELGAIDVGDRFRFFSHEHAEKLKVSYTDYGRTAPIIVRPHPLQGGIYLLVAGLHRLEGARAAGLTEIDAEVRDLTAEEARRVEIAENAFRFELTALDRMRSFAELAELWEAEHPKNPGGRPKKNSGNVFPGFAARFSEEAQKRVGLTPRAIRGDIAIARALTPEAIELLAHTPIADNAAQLRLLAKEVPKDQVLIARKVASGEASSVKAARIKLGIAAAVENDPEERIVTQIVDLLSRAKPRTRRRIVEHMRLKGWLDALPQKQA